MNLPPELLNFTIWITIPAGVVLCFFGYRFFKIILGTTGFLAGGGLAYSLVYALAQQEWVAIVMGLLGGALGAGLLTAVYFLGVLLLGGGFGAALGAALFASTGMEPGIVGLLVLAGLGSITALIFQKFMIVAATGFGGAWVVAAGIAQVLAGAIDPIDLEWLYRPGGEHYLVVPGWLVLGLAGVIVQLRSASGGQKPHPFSDQPDKKGKVG